MVNQLQCSVVNAGLYYVEVDGVRLEGGHSTLYKAQVRAGNLKLLSPEKNIEVKLDNWTMRVEAFLYFPPPPSPGV